MTSRVGRFILPLILATLTAASLAFARTYSIDVAEACKLGSGPTIRPGQYNVQIQNAQTKPEAVYYKSGKQIAKVPVQLVDAPHNFNQTEFVSVAKGNQRVMTEMRFRGWHEKILLNGTQTPAESKP